jgi:hypothetical protein
MDEERPLVVARVDLALAVRGMLRSARTASTLAGDISIADGAR